LRETVAQRQEECKGLVEKLRTAIHESNWREVIAVADQVLQLAPQHWEAREARTQAYQHVEPPTLAMSNPPVEPSRSPTTANGSLRRALLWIDGVGGYLLCLSEQVSFGQATPNVKVDIPIFADISRLHGYFFRDGEGYLLEAVHPVVLNQQTVQRGLLQDGDRLTLGSSCQWRFAQPVPVSSTARLDFVSGHRLRWAVDGVILMSETCVLGATGAAHIPIQQLRRRAVLFRTNEGLGVQIGGDFILDGQPCRNRAVLAADSTVAWDEFRFTLEPLPSGGRL
jgi:hypothetical protein